jgi:hypothetical protein
VTIWNGHTCRIRVWVSADPGVVRHFAVGDPRVPYAKPPRRRIRLDPSRFTAVRLGRRTPIRRESLLLWIERIERPVLLVRYRSSGCPKTRIRKIKCVIGTNQEVLGTADILSNDWAPLSRLISPARTNLKSIKCWKRVRKRGRSVNTASRAWRGSPPSTNYISVKEAMRLTKQGQACWGVLSLSSRARRQNCQARVCMFHDGASVID